jgi:hypothetical protein
MYYLNNEKVIYEPTRQEKYGEALDLLARYYSF